MAGREERKPINNQNSFQSLIVVGASAGGPEALRVLAAGLQPDLPAAVLIVQHLAPDSPSMLPALLERAGSLPAATARDGEPLLGGRILLPPPNHHLVVQEDGEHGLYVRVTHGPRENRARPSIDVLFRSAAVACNGRTIGVLLTGLLSDGVRGLEAVGRCGGVTIVQDPADAAYPQMVQNALAATTVDHRLPLIEIAPLLNRLAHRAAPRSEPPDELRLEVAVNLAGDSTLQQMKRFGDAVTLSCPECGGRLWRESGSAEPAYYLCEVGHGFNSQALLDSMDREVERSLWVALRTLEERVRMLEEMAADAEAKDYERVAIGYRERAEETGRDAQNLRQFLLRSAR